MSRKTSVFLMLALLLLVPGVLYAQTNGPAPEHTDPTWQAYYWNNQTLSGDYRLNRTESNIDWDWGNGAPDSSIPADHFSARWTRYIDVTAGRYRFTATSDDGIRIYVDDQLILNQWQDHSVTTFTADIDLSAGHHQVRVEYYENGGFAVAKVSWASLSSGSQQWHGEYFNNRSLSGTPILVREDASILFDWGRNAPISVVDGDNFSVRWTRELSLDAGQYIFTATADDGVRLWVNGHLLIDQWHDHPATSYEGSIYVSGRTTVVMEYYESTGLAYAALKWWLSGSGSGNGTAVIVNDTDADFVRGGTTTAWRTEAEGNGGHLTWTYNNDYARDNYNWARWYPHLTPGRYEVFVYIPDRFSTTVNARYWVSHRDGYTLHSIDQSAYSEQWVSLGTYYFQGTSVDYVSLSDVTFEPFLSHLVVFDAIKWEPR